MALHGSQNPAFVRRRVKGSVALQRKRRGNPAIKLAQLGYNILKSGAPGTHCKAV
jgi:hypothetical protein